MWSYVFLSLPVDDPIPTCSVSRCCFLSNRFRPSTQWLCIAMIRHPHLRSGETEHALWAPCDRRTLIGGITKPPTSDSYVFTLMNTGLSIITILYTQNYKFYFYFRKILHLLDLWMTTCIWHIYREVTLHDVLVLVKVIIWVWYVCYNNNKEKKKNS